MTGFEPATSSVTGKRALQAALHRHVSFSSRRGDERVRVVNPHPSRGWKSSVPRRPVLPPGIEPGLDRYKLSVGNQPQEHEDGSVPTRPGVGGVYDGVQPAYRSSRGSGGN